MGARPIIPQIFNIMKWDYNGSMNAFQFDWNSTLFTIINMAALKSGNEIDVTVTVPTRLKEIIEPNIMLIGGYEKYKKKVVYTDSDKDIIDVNGVEISILNYKKR
jgi:hypothetical protein